MWGGGARITLKIVEFMACLACILTKAITDQRTRQVYLINQKHSREWSLLNTITWTVSGNAFTNVTFGEYAVLTAIMAVTSCINSYYRVSIFEKIILILGIFQFLAVGGLVLAAIDQIPYQLLNYAIGMGVLSFFVAILFVIDLGNGAPKRPFTQAHSVVLIEKPGKEKEIKTEEVIINTDAKDTNNYIDQRSSLNETQTLQRHHEGTVQPPVFARTKSYAERRNVGDTHIKRRSMENLTQLRDSEDGNIHYLSNRSRSNTYIPEPKIDQESYPHQTSIAEPRMNVIRFYYPQHQHARQIYLRQAGSNEDLPTMVTPGYVKNTAKQWEQRVSGVKPNKNFPSLDTIV